LTTRPLPMECRRKALPRFEISDLIADCESATLRSWFW
jgi:hypothetical protein